MSICPYICVTSCLSVGQPVCMRVYCLLENQITPPKWKHFPRYWHFVRGIHRSPANSPHKGQWRGVLMFSLICTRINGWVNNGEADDLRRHRARYDVTVMPYFCLTSCLYVSHPVCMPVYCMLENLITSSNGNIFRVTGTLCGEFTGHRWIPLTKAGDAELCFFFICAWTSGWMNNRDAGDMRR